MTASSLTEPASGRPGPQVPRPPARYLRHKLEFTTVGNISTPTIGAWVGSVDVGDGV